MAFVFSDKMVVDKLTLCAILLSFQYVHGLSRTDPLVDTKVGQIRGLSAPDGDYSMFMGIPYGTVDKDNPFAAATPYPNFSEPFEAYDDTAICPQIEEFNRTIAGTLDCLHLSVYVPNSASSENRLPVLLWIHGGAFRVGSSRRYLYGPKFLVQHDVILVSINYRLGPYGFLCLDSPRAPGNQGLKDQYMAMKWVKNNIEAFGGDPEKITIFGQSAGAMLVDMHLYYDNEVLFSQLITQSSSISTPIAVNYPDTEAHFKLCKQIGFETEDLDEALDFLASVEPALIIAASNQIDTLWRPCVEEEFEGVERYIDEFPVNINPNLRNMSVLSGINEFERLTDYALRPAEYYETNDAFATFMTYLTFEDERVEEMIELTKHYYLGDDPISIEKMTEIMTFHADSYNNYPTLSNAYKYFRNGAHNVYFYMFTYSGGRNYFKDLLNVDVPGAAHCDELGYLFDIEYMTDTPTPEDQRVIDILTTLWTNFAKYGNPTPQQSDLLPITWLPLEADTMHYMILDLETKMATRPWHSNMAFWELFYVYNEQYQVGFKDPNN